MRQDLQLGYLVLDVTDARRWQAFCRDLLGLTVREAEGSDETHVRMDALQQRFVLQPGNADDLAVVGLIALNRTILDQLTSRVRAWGIDVQEASPEAARARRVRHLVSFSDPAGTRVELAAGPFKDVVPFASPLVPDGFLTGPQGLGHAVFMVDDLETTMGFWVDALGFELSDTSARDTPAGESSAAFLHCNARHHSIALVQRAEHSTYPKSLMHFMIQANSMDAVGMAFDRALDAGLVINRSLGRHPNDRMFSFYATTPSGFDFEFGWGAVEVGENWAADHYDHISAWGHRAIS